MTTATPTLNRTSHDLPACPPWCEYLRPCNAAERHLNHRHYRETYLGGIGDAKLCIYREREDDGPLPGAEQVYLRLTIDGQVHVLEPSFAEVLNITAALAQVVDPNLDPGTVDGEAAP